MERRIVATPRTERLFDLYKIYVLAGRPGSAEASYVGPAAPSMRCSRSMRRTPSTPSRRRPPHPTTSSGHGARMSANAPALSSGKSAAMTSRPQADRPPARRPARRERVWGRDARRKARGRGASAPTRPASSAELHLDARLTGRRVEMRADGNRAHRSGAQVLLYTASALRRAIPLARPPRSLPTDDQDEPRGRGVDEGKYD